MLFGEEDFILKWSEVSRFWNEKFGKSPDLNAILFLIGIREVGTLKQEFKKEEKMDLMHVAICRILMPSGYYTLEGHDQDGWPVYTQVRDIPSVDLFTQERLLKEHVIQYFEDEQLFSEDAISADIS